MLVGCMKRFMGLGTKPSHMNTVAWTVPAFLRPVCHPGQSQHLPVLVGYSQFSAPPVWYSITRVSKKLRSFFRSIISLIHGKGFSSLG